MTKLIFTNPTISKSILRSIPEAFRLVPTSLAEATNGIPRIVNHNELKVGEQFFSATYGTIEYKPNTYGVLERKRVSSNTDFLATGNHVMFAAPGAETPVCSKHHILDVINNIDILRSVFDTISILTSDTPDVLDAWLKNLVQDAKWYDSNEHDTPDILHKLNLIGISDPSRQLINAIGAARDGGELEITTKRFMLLLKDGVSQDICIEHKVQTKWEHVSAKAAFRKAMLLEPVTPKAKP